LVIVGDLHGDSDSLRKILSHIGYEKFLRNPRNKLIFLGDYVDRGSDSIGIIQTVTSLKTKYPDSTVLMRGNHEAPIQFPFPSHSLSFELSKEFPNAKSLYEKILSIFELLTVVTLVEGSLILVHGGLPISSPQRDSDYNTSKILLSSSAVLEQILWNDPRDALEKDSEWEKSRRAFGFHYSEVITKKWLDALGARVVIRGHEPCRGIRISHSDRVITLFSSKQAYPDFNAAFIQISARDLQKVKRASDIAMFATSF
jgi:hypothetical protein